MHIFTYKANNTDTAILIAQNKKSLLEMQSRRITMKATGIVRRIDDLGRVVIPKEIRRTMRIREGDPSQVSLTPEIAFCIGMQSAAERGYIGKK